MQYEFKPFEKVLVRVCNSKWHPDFYSYYDEDEHIHITIGLGSAEECIPYAGNEKLAGAPSNPVPPEPEFRFGDKVEVRDTMDEPWKRGIFKRRQNDQLSFMVLTENCDRIAGWRYCRHTDW